jgi:hypothetical protein
VRLRALVPVVLTLILAASAVMGTSVWELVTFPITTMPHPGIDLSAAPAGWVPVAYGDAQVSVPPTWAVMTHAWCGGTWPPIVQLGVVKQDMDCPAAQTPLRFGSPRSVRSLLPTGRSNPSGSMASPFSLDRRLPRPSPSSCRRCTLRSGQVMGRVIG